MNSHRNFKSTNLHTIEPESKLDLEENERDFDDVRILAIEDNNLPIHPLKPLGYESIGCKHCTLKGKKRKGRWAQTVKTECGLHL